jgi:hypothetical protein
MVVIAIPLGWKVNRVRNQRLVMAEIQKLNGFVIYDYQRNFNVGISTSAGPPGPNWLRDLLGVDYFADIAHVNVSGPQVTNDTLAHLSSLPHLQLLGIDSDQITDSGVAMFARSKDLISFGVTSKNVTVASIDHLQGLPNLVWLQCSGRQVNDSWISHIIKLKSLESVCLHNTEVTDEGIAELASLPKLHGLYFEDMPITDARLEQLHGMSNLIRVGLHQTQVTKNGIKRLQTALPSCVVRQY